MRTNKEISMINEANDLSVKPNSLIESYTEGVTEYMPSITYGVIEEIYSLSCSSRRSYGIAVYSDSPGDGFATVLASVNDISSDREKLEELVQICNRTELSLIHLNDIINDFLAN